MQLGWSSVRAAGQSLGGFYPPVIVIVYDKIQSTQRCELCQLLKLQYMEVASLVAVYTFWTVLQV